MRLTLAKHTVWVVYKITNIINNHYYYGKTNITSWGGGYMGSGKLIEQAVREFGKDNFNREIVKTFTNEFESYMYESNLIVPNRIDPMSYNTYDTSTNTYCKDGTKMSEVTIRQKLIRAWEKRGAIPREFILKHYNEMMTINQNANNMQRLINSPKSGNFYERVHGIVFEENLPYKKTKHSPTIYPRSI